MTAADLYAEESPPCASIEVNCTAQQGWTISTVDPARFGRYCSLAFDSGGTPSIAYYVWFDLDNGHMLYAGKNTGDWLIEEIQTEGNSGMYCCLAIDAEDNPVISYQDWHGELRVARHDGTDWDIEIVDPGPSCGFHTSCLAGSVGPYPDLILVSYQVGTPDFDVKLAGWDGISWVTDSFESPNQQGGYTSLAWQSTGLWGLSFLDGTARNPCYCHHDGVEMQFEEIVTTALAAGSHPLAYDSLDRPAIAFQDALQWSLMFARHNGASWDIETVENPSNKVASYSDLVFDLDDNPIIAYRDSTAFDLKVAWHNGTSWEIEVVDEAGQTGEYPSIALNPDGNPIIAYGGINFVKLASWSG